ncbi:hypothetical protein BX281_3132 [Streptomyces sp. Ag82_O1-15]|nr:hypothetical protein BX281_3132 [Streptomyces sp. Ag82_O1-15]
MRRAPRSATSHLVRATAIEADVSVAGGGLAQLPVIGGFDQLVHEGMS